MTNKQIISWLKNQQAQALDKVCLQKVQALDAYNSQLYEKVGLKEIADKVYTLLNEVDDLIIAWHKNNKDYIGEVCCYYGSIRSKISSFIDSPIAAYNQLKDYEIPRTMPAYQNIDKHFDSLHGEVERTYDNVILNVRKLKSAKLALEYLKELNFDLTTLFAEDVASVETALSVPIETKYLMLGGSNNDN